MRNFQMFAITRWQGGGMRQHVFERPQHEGEGGSEFMADIGEKCCFSAIDFGKHVSALAFFLDFARVLNSRGYLAGDQFQKRDMIGIERATGIDADNEYAVRIMLAARSDREDRGLCDGLVGNRHGKPWIPLTDVISRSPEW